MKSLGMPHFYLGKHSLSKGVGLSFVLENTKGYYGAGGYCYSEAITIVAKEVIDNDTFKNSK